MKLFIFLIITTYSFDIKKATRKGVPELRGPALSCMSAIDNNSANIFCKDNCISLPHGPES